ncbi:MAG: hypothetical protein AAF288_05665 [Planctomycetota bacterium]
MSEKYRRVKQADLALPAPVRWLTRAFSSIRMSVTLLTLVALYGLFASVPLPLIAGGAAYALIGMGWVGVAAGLWWALLKLVAPDAPRAAKATGYLLVGAGAVVAAVFTCIRFYHDVLTEQPWWLEHRATTVYRLPGVEMTELEFYSAWPMKLLLGLFVCNMVWATVRRIAFNVPNLGVLTVHTGIVTMALGAMAYGSFKLEGDMLLPRADLDAEQAGFRRYVYDRNDPALYVGLNGAVPTMFSLKGELPRYNDYEPDALSIPLHGRPDFANRFGPELRVTVSGFYSYAEMVRDLVPAATDPAHNPGDGAPGLVVSRGLRDQPDPDHIHLLRANRPDESGYVEDGLIVEMPLEVDPQRRAELLASIDGATGLVIQAGRSDSAVTDQEPFARAVQPGDAFDVDVSGATLRVRVLATGDYPFPFSTPGYQRAQDTCAVLHLSDGQGYEAIRFAMHRFPEVAQDFVYDPDAPGAPPQAPDLSAIQPGAVQAMLGQLGGLQRSDPDPRFRIAFANDNFLQYRLVPLDPQMTRFDLFMRGQRLPALVQPIAFSPDPAQRQLPLGSTQPGAPWLHLMRAVPDAVPVLRPVAVDKAARQSREEGTHLHAILPVRVERVNPSTGDTLFSQRVFLRHTLYADDHRIDLSRSVDVPGVGRVNIIFSRVRYPMPFMVRLTDFQREMFPGSDDTRDFIASLEVVERGEGRQVSDPTALTARMNNPAHFQPASGPFYLSTVKLSQNQWDPGDPELAPAEKNQRDAQGRFVNQQRWSVVGVSNNVAIQVIAGGLILVLLGIPWAFYVKPWIMRRRRAALAERTQEKLAQRERVDSAGLSDPTDSEADQAPDRQPSEDPEPAAV